jgi:hypothetical protein
MGKDDVRSALEAMDDDEVRSRLAAGDFAAVGGLELSDHERDLVQQAAADYPEVAGFAFDAFLTSPKVESLPAVQGGASPLEGKFKLPFNYQSALDYIKI